MSIIRGTFIIFILCFRMAQVHSPHHFLHFAIENFCCLILPKGLIFFCFCHYSFLISHLIAFLFMIRRLPKSFLNFLLVTIENFFQRPVFHRASLLFLLFLLFSEFIDFMWDFLCIQIAVTNAHSRPHVSHDIGSMESRWPFFCIHLDADWIPFLDQ